MGGTANEGAYLRRAAVLLIVFALILEYIVAGALMMHDRIDRELAMIQAETTISVADARPREATSSALLIVHAHDAKAGPYLAYPSPK